VRTPRARRACRNLFPQPTAAQLAAAGLKRFPLALDKQRVDLVAPAFSNPTSVTNPLFPIGRLHSAILNGQVDSKQFRVETTLLPETRIVEWTDGQCVETLVSQYVAYLDGRIEEVALDLYARCSVAQRGRSHRRRRDARVDPRSNRARARPDRRHSHRHRPP
jgi:hypothetical protein